MIMTVVTGDGRLHAAAPGDLRWSEVSKQPADRFRSGLSPEPGQTIRIVEVPDSAEGMRSEPAVSVPVAAGVMRAASAAAEPPLDPPAVRSSAHGLPTWSVVPPTANSWVWVWPSSTMPAAFRFAQTSLSRSGTSSNTLLEAASGLPATA